MRSLIDKLSEKLAALQSPARFRHSRAVSRLAGELAEKHGWNSEKARLAGLAHDWAKEWSPDRLLAYVDKHKLDIPDLPLIRIFSPNLLHAYVSADFVRRHGWITDSDSLKAIAAHTLGAVPMGRPEKILYVADLAAYDRRYAEVERLRKKAFVDLDLAFAGAVEVKVKDLIERRKPFHPLVLSVWNRVVCKVKS